MFKSFFNQTTPNPLLKQEGAKKPPGESPLLF